MRVGWGSSNRVCRGGSWNNNDPSRLRGANRNNNTPDNRNNNLGFRCASTRNLPAFRPKTPSGEPEQTRCPNVAPGVLVLVHPLPTRVPQDPMSIVGLRQRSPARRVASTSYERARTTGGIYPSSKHDVLHHSFDQSSRVSMPRMRKPRLHPRPNLRCLDRSRLKQRAHQPHPLSKSTQAIFAQMHDDAIATTSQHESHEGYWVRGAIQPCFRWMQSQAQALCCLLHLRQRVSKHLRIVMPHEPIVAVTNEASDAETCGQQMIQGRHIKIRPYLGSQRADGKSMGPFDRSP